VIGRLVPVKTITRYVRNVLESDEILADIWIQGEVSSLYQHRSGHVYFSLQEGDAQLKCVLFRAHARRHRRLPAAGDLVVAHGSVSLYEQNSSIQLYVDSVQPAGLGIAALELERLRQRLEAEGLFDESRKRPLPAAPRCIGVVTSPDGAVWHDIQHVLRRRYPLAHLVLSPAHVQGERAPSSVVVALEALQVDGRAEVIIVARGGGAAEDLAAFNDEQVVRAIFASRVPVISGIGHETDWTLADLVADLRAPTPSAAAEVCTPAIADLAFRVMEARIELVRLATDLVADHAANLRFERRNLERACPKHRISSRRQAVNELALRAGRGQRVSLERIRGDVDLQESLLRSLNPVRTLRRGYAAVSLAVSGEPVTSRRQLPAGDLLHVQFADGAVLSRVEARAATNHLPAEATP
jgi:exodeoxyribonuclease VII large subunit